MSHLHLLKNITKVSQYSFNIKLNKYIYTSLAELVQRLPSKQMIIGSSPVRCVKK
jgi:hypothetical protein